MKRVVIWSIFLVLAVFVLRPERLSWVVVSTQHERALAKSLWCEQKNRRSSRNKKKMRTTKNKRDELMETRLNTLFFSTRRLINAEERGSSAENIVLFIEFYFRTWIIITKCEDEQSPPIMSIITFKHFISTHKTVISGCDFWSLSAFFDIWQARFTISKWHILCEADSHLRLS